MARTAWVWTAERRAEVQASIQPGMTYADLARVAHAHGVSPKALLRAVGRRIVLKEAVYEKRDAVVIELRNRTCLCCGKAFVAESKFIRSCDTCRDKGSVLGDFSLGVVV